MTDLAIWVQLVPLLVLAARLPRRVSSGATIAALAFAFSLAEDLASQWIMRGGASNLWFLHLAMPVYPALLIWALSRWQRSPVSRMAFLLTIPIFILVWGGLIIWVEPLSQYSYIGGPIRSVLLVALSCYTLVTNAHDAAEPVWNADWFWISSGLLLSFAARVLLTPISAALVRSAPAELLRMEATFNAIDVVATLLVSWGVYCARTVSVSGGSSLPRSPSRVS